MFVYYLKCVRFFQPLDFKSRCAFNFSFLKTFLMPYVCALKAYYSAVLETDALEPL